MVAWMVNEMVKQESRFVVKGRFDRMRDFLGQAKTWIVLGILFAMYHFFMGYDPVMPIVVFSIIAIGIKYFEKQDNKNV